MALATLFNKHHALIRIEFENGIVSEIKEVIKKNQNLLPIILQGEGNLTLETLNKWLGTRRIPDKREGLMEARKWFHGFDRQKHMFGLSDQYWIRFKSDERWEELNFFTNLYDQEQGKIFFEPWNADVKRAIENSGPDITTNGVLRKRWIQDSSGRSYLLKAGSEKYHQEPLSEVLASITLKQLNIIPFVEYKLVIYGMQFCSRCPNFVTENTEFVPALHIYNKRPRRNDESIFDHFVAMCDEYNIIGAEEYMKKMIAADHILCNTDRHMGNFGFIRDASTGSILGFAPLFDFGRAFWGAPVAQDIASRFFADKEDACFKSVAKNNINLAEIDTELLKNLVDKYPEISDAQGDNIKARIDKSYKAMQKEKPFKIKKDTIIR